MPQRKSRIAPVVWTDRMQSLDAHLPAGYTYEASMQPWGIQGREWVSVPDGHLPNRGGLTDIMPIAHSRNPAPTQEHEIMELTNQFAGLSINDTSVLTAARNAQTFWRSGPVQ